VEWSSGTLVKTKFEESTVLPWYDAHLEKLHSWRELNAAVVDNICFTLYKRCRFVFRSDLLHSYSSFPADLLVS
jgi:hypothetical protein